MNASFSLKPGAGFTLIEMLVVVAIAAVLAGVAYPTFQHAIHKTRRMDAQVALFQLQMAQERYRSDHPSYARLSELGMATTSPMGHYSLVVAASSQTGFSAQAVASGAQASDTPCRHLQIEVDGLNTRRLSGSDGSVSNDASANKKCWGA
jgi:type IV pilus assembly protein PilE